NAGKISINTGNLSIIGSSFIFSLTNGEGNAGNITINARESVALESEPNQRNDITSLSFATGNSADIKIETPSLSLNNADISTSASGAGNAGDIMINSTDSIIVSNGKIEAFTTGSGNAGNLNVKANESININGAVTNGENVSPAGLFTSNFNENGNADAGDIILNTQKLSITEGAIVEAATYSAGNGGNINVEADDILIAGSEENFSSAIEAFSVGSGDGGTIDISVNKLNIRDNAAIAVLSIGDGNAGQIFAQVRDSLDMDNGFLSSSSDRSSGGEIAISAGSIRLRGNSNISTFVNSGGSGGNLTLTADSIVAFDDSDIFASSFDGVGGNITLDTDAFFAANFDRASLNANPGFLDGNNRVDINATGAVDGFIDIPNVNFLPNSLIRLSEDTLNTEEVVSNTCVVPNQEQSGTFVVTGTGGLAVRPNDAAVSNYGTGDVRSLPQKQVTSTEENWQPGEPIVEPEGMYRLSNGQLVLSRKCN
ncbi:MAG: hypothetical protein ACRC80_00990, partial [Waterburya sp.]